MKKIKLLYDVIFFILGKDVASKHPPEQVDLILYDVIVSLFNKHYEDYVMGEKIDRRLDPFKKSSTETLVSGKVALNSEFALIRPPMYFTDGTKVELVPDLFWHNRKSRVIGPASLTRPICRIEVLNDVLSLEVYPEPTDSKITVNYFKVPDKPKYAYTVSGTKYIYDDASSVDYEFPELMLPLLAAGVCRQLGFNIREEEIVQYMNQMEVKQN